MIEMSPYYAFESDVGPVFDAATWSRRKAWFLAGGALVFGLLVAAALVFAWQPTLVIEKPPKLIVNIHEETLDLAKDSPWVAYGTSAVAGLIALASLAAAYASATDAANGEYYFRAGPGGLSICVPQGLDFRKFCLAFERLELDIPMDRIADWRIVQKKQLGSMSRSTGNIAATFHIRTTDGKKLEFSLDCFREPSFVIQSKLNDAMQMVPVQFGPGDAEEEMETVPPPSDSRGYTAE